MSNQSNIIVSCAENCGNSPKKELLKEITIALAKEDFDFYLNHLSDEIIWDIVGVQQLNGIEAAKKSIHYLVNDDIKQLEIHNIITHGNVGSINGTLLSKKETTYFCHVFNFAGNSKNSKIKKISSYIIKQ